MSVYLFTTLDTKGQEAQFLREQLEALGVKVSLVDTGCLGTPLVQADISREQVFQAAGMRLEELQSRHDRGAAVIGAAQGAEAIAREAYSRGDLQAVLGLGGGAGTSIGTAAMRALPIGVPKLMVSTLASGQVQHYVGSSDILMLNSIVDIAGLNRISRVVLTRAAQAMAGMVLGAQPAAQPHDKALIAASMFGVTTPCVEAARAQLEAAGYEVLVFHATGSGGRTLETLAESGLLAGVLDITTTELADELVGGFLSAGPSRLTAAGRRGIPQVVSAGALDMVNFHGIDSVPAQFRARQLYVHNANVTLMRTTPSECEQLGRMIGEKLANAQGERCFVFPMRGISAIDRAGQPFEDAAARAALLQGLRASLGSVELICRDEHINDPSFAKACADALLQRLKAMPR